MTASQPEPPSPNPLPEGEGATGADPVILKRFRAALDLAYGDRIERVLLYGSRARGDAGLESDYDVAVFIRDHRGSWEENLLLAEVTTDILLDTGALIEAIPFPEGAYRERTGFMREVRKDGLDL